MNKWIEKNGLHVFECSQGSPEWFQARVGYPTASEFSKIVGIGADKSKARNSYANKIVAEIILKQSTDIRPPTFHEERGQMMENEAANSYEFATSKKDVRCILGRAGFVVNSQKTAGCSLDRFVLDANGTPIGGVEIKCLTADKHMELYFRNKMQPENVAQVQGQLWVTKLPWIDTYYYHPGLPYVRIQVTPELAYHARITESVDSFRELISKKLEICMERGILDR